MTVTVIIITISTNMLSPQIWTPKIITHHMLSFFHLYFLWKTKSYPFYGRTLFLERKTVFFKFTERLGDFPVHFTTVKIETEVKLW